MSGLGVLPGPVAMTPEARALLEPMLAKPLFAALASLREGESLEPLLAEHLAYMVRLEADGHLFAAGPFTDEHGKPSGGGLILLRAADIAEARRLAADDPFVRGGVRDVHVQPWRLMEGRVNVSLNLSRGTFDFN